MSAADPINLVPLVAVVEDDALIRTGLALEIERKGLGVLALGDEEELPAKLAGRSPKLIILDLSLGRSDAIEVMKGLSKRNYPGLVQLVSGLDQETLDETHAIGLRFGLKLLIPLRKPLLPETLETLLASFVPKPANSVPLVDMKEALERDWLEVWYQPKISLQRNVLAGAEALLRLRHPTLGLLSPAAFIPSATQDPYAQMTDFVLQTIARDWPKLGPVHRKLPIAVNASIRLIERPSFLETLTRSWPTMADRLPLIIEVTEDEVISDLQLAHDAAVQLKLHGAALSIDDFGMGYSTFSRLRDLPCEEIKLDKDFVIGCSTDDRQRALCASVVSLAKEFGVSAVAEGIENAADLRVVRDLGFDMGQGYHFARPAQFMEFKTLIYSKRPKAAAASTIPPTDDVVFA